MTHTARFSIILCFCLGIASSVLAQPEPGQKGKLVGESENWKVEVVSAEYALPYEKIPGDSTKQFGPLGENRCYMFLRLHLEYRGPDGDVPGPRVTLVNDKNEKFDNSGNLTSQGDFNYDMAPWFFSATYDDPKQLKTFPLKTGQIIADPWLEFLIIIPTDSKDLRLMFGGEEIPGILVTPTKLK